MFEKNLKYYRLQKNLSKKALAEACNVSPMAISNYENGKRRPDMDVIRKLAEALGVHVADFLAARNANLTFSHCEFRKHSSLTESRQELVRESVEEYFSRFFDTVECLGGKPLPGPPACHALSPTSNYEDDAKLLRKSLGLPEEGPVGEIISSLEDRGILIVEIDIQNDHFSGINGMVNEFPYIAINKYMRSERKRTTILHELAHIMFADSKMDEKDNEKWATAVAGAMLISKTDLFRELGIKKSHITKDMALVCEEYGISMYLLVKRAAQAGIISTGVERNFYIEANRADWKKNEPNRVRKEEKTQLLRQLVFRAVNEEELSVSRGAELLKISTSEMKNFCGLMEV